MRKTTIRSSIAACSVLALAIAACGSDDGDGASVDTEPEATSSATTEGDAVGDTDVPTIVVTTNILGDVVEEVVGDAADVVTIMPVGADPHDFQASAQEVDTLMSAHALVVNGAGFEEGLLDVIENAEDEGVPTFEAISVVETIEFGEGGHDHEAHSDEEHSDEAHSDEEHSDEEHSDEEHSDEEHSDEEHSDESDSDEAHSEDEDGHGHDHSGEDPHFFADPMRMAAAVDGMVDFLQAELVFADPAALDESAAAYVAELTALDSEVTDMLDPIPAEGRVLVTNHEVFGYFADRYDFEVVGAVIPAGTTTDSASAGELAELAEIVEAEGVPAIFSDTSAPDELIQTIADEVGAVEVVALYTESLGDADSDGATYLGMVRTNAERISSALA